ncbi:hypothetical protein G7Y89_g14442 [Cudoniella acicularis]|uniref:DUF7918 domain-containing protein n=1 Tax=Cudoniella acicularis TaxID=354080 RepID=A0A8H4R3U2_9HELO|nr:hypothetical protein G7Y89_g14442 [Cudoniella acicularis]
MAIFDSLLGLEATVLVDGIALKEFEDNEDESPGVGPINEYRASKTVSKYIESTSDKDYSLRLTVDQLYAIDSPSLIVKVVIDGKVMRKFVIELWTQAQQNKRLIKPNSSIVKGQTVRDPNDPTPNRGILRKFRFAKIEVTQDDSGYKDIKTDAKHIEQVGEIAFEVYRASKSERSTTGKITKTTTPPAATAVHEKALKGQAKSHSTLFGSSSTITESFVTCVEIDHLGGSPKPIAIFKFKYRSNEALKQLMVLPRTPSPSPSLPPVSADPLNLENLDGDQKRRLQAFLQELTGGGNGSPGPAPKIKRERNTDGNRESFRKKRKSRKSQVIDLTEDAEN